METSTLYIHRSDNPDRVAELVKEELPGAQIECHSSGNGTYLTIRAIGLGMGLMKVGAAIYNPLTTAA